jgi:cold shock protein
VRAEARPADMRCWPRLQFTAFQEVNGMPEGKIKKLTDKGFGFIDTGDGNDMFFHMSNLEGVQYEDLREGQRVSYNPGRGPKGPRAENVRPL